MRAVVLDAESVPFVDVTALRVLVQVGEELASSGVVLALAHGIGQVEDLIGHEPGAEETLTLYPTVDAAVADLGPS